MTPSGIGKSVTTNRLSLCPSYVSYLPSSCIADICRIRLDFVNTVMAGPPTTDAGSVTEVGRCSVSGDYVTVNSPTKNAIPQMCGTLTGQHSMKMYHGLP